MALTVRKTANEIPTATRQNVRNCLKLGSSLILRCVAFVFTSGVCSRLTSFPFCARAQKYCPICHDGEGFRKMEVSSARKGRLNLAIYGNTLQKSEYHLR